MKRTTYNMIDKSSCQGKWYVDLYFEALFIPAQVSITLERTSKVLRRAQDWKDSG